MRKWECSECGEVIERKAHPTRCTSCGLAGVLFSRVEDDEAEDGGARGYWFRRGAGMSGYAGPASFFDMRSREGARA
jgi:DNA-directed RNA polymerase subunit RPC12/RpoP